MICITHPVASIYENEGEGTTYIFQNLKGGVYLFIKLFSKITSKRIFIFLENALKRVFSQIWRDKSPPSVLLTPLHLFRVVPRVGGAQVKFITVLHYLLKY